MTMKMKKIIKWGSILKIPLLIGIVSVYIFRDKFMGSFLFYPACIIILLMAIFVMISGIIELKNKK